MTRSRYVGVALAATVVAACLLFFRLAAHDPLTDEEEIAFRAIGYMDFLAAPYQTTPYEWFATPPWWVSLSFHDHPPLLFALEHLVFRVLGDSLLVVRLPFALFGLASLLLLGDLARRLYDDRVACVVVALAAVNTYWLWVFRLGIQEGPVIFFLLASLCCLARGWLLGWVVAAGLGLLTKYTSVLVFPLSLAYVLLVDRCLLRARQWLVALPLVVMLVSPVIVYDVALWRAVGHFDLQLASLLHQATPEWTVLPGKDIGSIAARAAAFGPLFWRNATWLFVVLVAGSLLAIVARRKRADVFVLAALGTTAVFLLLIGPSQRFLALLVPFALLACGAGLPGIVPSAAIALAVVGEAFISFQTFHAVRPTGTVSALRAESAAYGYGALEDYMHELLDSARPAVVLDLPPKLGFIASFRARHPRRTGGETRARLVVYDPRMNNVAKLWIYDRRYYYDGWPIVSVDAYAYVEEVEPGLFTRLGITDFYYLATEPGLETVGNGSTSERADAFRAKVAASAVERVVRGRDGRAKFTVFHWRGEP